tara:strand:+ start:10283 stop:10492 length:210 start_codon:yes stop_codon:yes gene_type:complete
VEERNYSFDLGWLMMFMASLPDVYDFTVRFFLEWLICHLNPVGISCTNFDQGSNAQPADPLVSTPCRPT